MRTSRVDCQPGRRRRSIVLTTWLSVAAVGCHQPAPSRRAETVVHAPRANAVTPPPAAEEATGGGRTSLAVGRGILCRLVAGKLSCRAKPSFGHDLPGAARERIVIDDVLEVGSMDSHACARRSRETLCWGRNDDGQLGDGTTASSWEPRLVMGLSDGWKLSVGGGVTCAITRARAVVCWGGRNAVSRPKSVAGLPPLAEIAAGYFHACGLTGDGRAWCWSESFDDARPVELPRASSIVAGSHTCALTHDSKVYCWGTNGNRQCQNSDVSEIEQPLEVEAARGATQIVASPYGTCALRADHSALCWGSISYDGSPEVIAVLTGSTKLAAGSDGVCGSKQDGSVVCRGEADQLLPLAEATGALTNRIAASMPGR